VADALKQHPDAKAGDDDHHLLRYFVEMWRNRRWLLVLASPMKPMVPTLPFIRTYPSEALAVEADLTYTVTQGIGNDDPNNLLHVKATG